jgi:hypothetical protein
MSYVLCMGSATIWKKQCLLTTRVRLDCDLDLVWGQDWFWSNLNFKRVSSVSVLTMSGVVFSLKRRIALFFTGESCIGLSPLCLRMSFIASHRIKSIMLGKCVMKVFSLVSVQISDSVQQCQVMSTSRSLSLRGFSVSPLVKTRKCGSPIEMDGDEYWLILDQGCSSLLLLLLCVCVSEGRV